MYSEKKEKKKINSEKNKIVMKEKGKFFFNRDCLMYWDVNLI